MAKAEQLHTLKRKRTWKRNNITRFANSINSLTGETSLDDHEYYKGRIKEALEHIVACFASAGWMTFRNLRERDCNNSGTLRVLPLIRRGLGRMIGFINWWLHTPS
jgi:hypothetical protein